MLLHYRQLTKSPQSDWIVFFHGMGGDCSIFYKQIPAFQEHYNLLLIDLPGHGQSASLNGEEPVEFAARKVIELLEHLRIPPAHFMGVSLGTIVMQSVALLRPDRVKAMVLAGAAGRFLPWGQWLVKTSLTFPLVHVLPARVAYILFAHILLPRRNHRTSRALFIRVARGLRTADYRAWASVAYLPDRTYVQLAQRKNTIPKLYVSGAQDHMFLPTTRSFVEREALANLVVLPACGHVCNIEQAPRFNELALAFLQKYGALHGHGNDTKEVCLEPSK
ncbi:alpha/beta hydrolase [Stigmatella sp. ncwal1]|uniref:Alpha/beta hydrolase n=1 Tax=Stigmatella ashevillensis TaxID=2995309 RepID=A0ABT5DH37_9BACT|nr:alpha/beta hydrolase [Stigmatella ashevillena]MDC0712987.1 alpha/beta hydrolase [Stigmatella ashevillena]